MAVEEVEKHLMERITDEESQFMHGLSQEIYNHFKFINFKVESISELVDIFRSVSCTGIKVDLQHLDSSDQERVITFVPTITLVMEYHHISKGN